MLKVTCLKVANEISSLQFKLAPSAWREISLVISIHVIFLHLACVDNQPEIDCNRREIPSVSRARVTVTIDTSAARIR